MNKRNQIFGPDVSLHCITACMMNIQSAQSICWVMLWLLSNTLWVRGNNYRTQFSVPVRFIHLFVYFFTIVNGRPGNEHYLHISFYLPGWVSKTSQAWMQKFKTKNCQRRCVWLKLSGIFVQRWANIQSQEFPQRQYINEKLKAIC